MNRAWAMVCGVGVAAGPAIGQLSFEVLPSAVGSGRGLARGVSGDGRVIAGSTSMFSTEKPFIWRKVDGAWVRFDLPAEGAQGLGRPVALSYTGDVIGGMTNQYLPSAAGYGTPAVWRGVLSGTPTVTTPLDDPPAQPKRGVFGGVTLDGSLAAGYAAMVFPTTAPGEAWTLGPGGLAQLSPVGSTNGYLMPFLCGNAVSGDGAVIVGSRQTIERRLAFRWTAAGGFQDLPTPTTAFRNSIAETISRDGTVIGGCLTFDPSAYNIDARPVIWTSAGRVDLPIDPPSGPSGRVMALSADGRIAAGVLYGGILPLEGPSFTTATAVLWIDGRVSTLAKYLTARGVSLENVMPNWITGISDDGRVLVGFGQKLGVGLVSFMVTLPPPCAADLNGDGFADFSDYLNFLNLYEAHDLAADFTGDGLVDFTDYLEFLNVYEAGC